MDEGSWVGLDVHARSVVAGVIDRASGEVRSLRVPAGCDATVAWLKTTCKAAYIVACIDAGDRRLLSHPAHIPHGNSRRYPPRPGDPRRVNDRPVGPAVEFAMAQHNPRDSKRDVEGARSDASWSPDPSCTGRRVRPP
jgi:hypothetical protein